MRLTDRREEQRRGHENEIMARHDEELIIEYQQGSEEAFEMLFQRYKKPILNFALRILGNRADAEDITADVFLILFTKKNLYKPDAKFSTWLFTVARNACITKLRKRKKMISLWFTKNESDETEQWDIPDLRDLQDEALIKRETVRQIRKSIYQLPHYQKEALVLREYHHFSYEEIAEVMQMSPSAVKSLLSRARANLREVLDPYLQHGSPLDL